MPALLMLNPVFLCFLFSIPRNQVYRTSNGDVSVPIYWSYNHHYEAYLMGAYAQMYEMPKMTGAMSSYGNVKNHGSRWRAISVRDDPRPDSNIPTSQYVE